jgi:flagellar basal-body rod protein FlgB
MGLFDQTMGLLRKSLDLRTANHKVLSTNIANAETPDYHVKNIPFQRVLDESIEGPMGVPLLRTNYAHLPADLERTVAVESSTEGVNIDQEMAKLAENNMMYQAGVQILIRKLEALKTTIIEGGK